MLDQIRHEVLNCHVDLIQIGDDVVEELESLSIESGLEDVMTLFGKSCLYKRGTNGYKLFKGV